MRSTWDRVEDAVGEWVFRYPFGLVCGLVVLILGFAWAMGAFEDHPCWTAPCHLARQTARGMEYVETRCVVCRPDAGVRR